MQLKNNSLGRDGVRSAIAIACAAAMGSLASVPAAQAADSITEALTGGKAKVNVRARYESVEQTNALKDADAVTVRTRLGYGTGEYKGFSLYGEFEDVTAVGNEDFSLPADVPKTHSVIADPEATEVNQAYISYAGLPDTTVKFGLQRIILDNARFVGNVGWRQNEQTFKAFTVMNKSLPDTSIVYSNVNQVHTIVGGEFDTDTNIVNASYSGLPFGKLTGYGYFIEIPNSPTSQKTLGVRFSGATELDTMKLLYTAEYAKQSDYKDGDSDIDADYTFLEGGVSMSGVTAKVGYEVLGEDDFSGFETPLATKHAFNGWTDTFLNTPANGLEDIYVLATTKVAGVKLLGVYHDFSADKGGADYGDEWGFLAAKKFGKHYGAGLKYASYDADSFGVDTDKLWLWGSFNF